MTAKMCFTTSATTKTGNRQNPFSERIPAAGLALTGAGSGFQPVQPEGQRKAQKSRRVAEGDA